MSGFDFVASQMDDVNVDIVQTIDKVKVWNKDQDVPLKQLEERLSSLLKIKKEQPSNAWVSDYISRNAIQVFLTSACSKLVSNNWKELLPIMQKIITEDEISQIHEGIFPGFQNLHQCLYPTKVRGICKERITDINGLMKFIKDCIKEQNSKKDSANRTLGDKLGEAIKWFRISCKQTYDELFVLILIVPFTKQSSNNDVIFKPLTMKNLKILLKQFSDQINKFRKYCASAKCLQSYLFLLLLEKIREKESHEQRSWITNISRLMTRCNPPLDTNISHLLDQYYIMHSLGNLELKLAENITGFSTAPGTLTVDQLKPTAFTALQEFSHLKGNGMTIITRLGLHGCLSQKLQIQDALSVRPKLLQTSFQKQSIENLLQLPYVILHRIISYDLNCRADFMAELRSSSSCSDDTEDYGDSDIDDENFNSDAASDGLHPLDCLLAVLICADDFLRQDLFARLAKCQIAVPFILPNPFTKELVLPIWALRTILKEISCSNDAQISHTVCMVDYPMPIISIIRCGEPEKQGCSKSRLINLVINDDGHDHFFHRHCPGGQYKSALVDGLVDMCWYIPKYGTEKDVFSDSLTFLNLHGDARHHQDQFAFLCQISSICIVMVHEPNMKLKEPYLSILKNVMPKEDLIFLNATPRSQTAMRADFPKTFWVNLLQKTDAEAKSKIRDRIKIQLKQNSKLIRIANASQSSPQSIHIDENSMAHTKGSQHARNIMSLIKKSKLQDVKQQNFPLQGKDLWMAWADENKELYRQTQIGHDETIHAYTEKQKAKELCIRSNQLQYVKVLTPVMKKFTGSLLELSEDTDYDLINYFLKSLKLSLDEFSRNLVSEHQKQYRTLKDELSVYENTLKLQIKENEKKEIKELKKKLVSLEEQILDSSLSLEDFFREIGQLYEAAQLLENMHDFISCMPKLVAELFVDGYPLEIMDGKAAHVPLQWVTAVLKETRKILGNPNVLVLSVLGIQSSGKSTMLNTVFGLQFKVASGRCTRGAFVQLIKLNKDVKTQTKYDYILIVDTEGLRALTLDPIKAQKHDNELATFVIGLANMTLINIKGEVLADIDDILQTCVHAFLRMDMVKYHPSCQFVYQNALSNIQTQVERAQFAQKLNKFTVNAAKEEHCEGQYEEFKQVIKFDDQTDVHYFPGLWKGDPPMGPINPGYSHKAQRLKYEIICERSKVSKICQIDYQDSSFQTFQTKITDLWKSLLKENFVFSFKNTLEIMAYNSLETQYSQWDVKFRSAMLDWELKAENEINTEPLDSVAAKVQQKIMALTDFVWTNLHKPVKLEMERYFKGPQSDILKQWKGRFELRLRTLAQNVQKNAEDHCKSLLQRREVSKEMERAKSKGVKYMEDSIQKYINGVKKEQQNLQDSINQSSISSDQLKKLMQMDLFDSTKINGYIKKGIITEDDRSQIEVYKGCGKEMSQKCLKDILQGEVLSSDKIHMILKEQKQTDKELQDKFNRLWQQLLIDCPRVPSKPDGYIYHEVEKMLREFAAGYESQVITIVQETKKLSLASLEFNPQKDVHYYENKGRVRHFAEKAFYYFGAYTNDSYKIEAMKIAREVFDEARQYIKRIERKKTGFRLAYISELLVLVRETIESCQSRVSCIKLTQKYSLEMYTIVCGFAISKFTDMDRVFNEQNDPILYIEKHVREPLLTKFINQYQQTEAEVRIADYLAAKLKQPVMDQVELKLGSTMVYGMKVSEHCFSNKKALKIKILIDLYHKNDYGTYLKYLSDVKQSLEDHIEKYTREYCNKISTDSKLTRLQSSASDMAIELIDKVQNVIREINASDIFKWLCNFSTNNCIRSEIGFSIDPQTLLEDTQTLTKFNLENFKSRLNTELERLKRILLKIFSTIAFESIKWQEKPHEILKSLVGCTAQCPFCGEQCELLEHEVNIDHRTEVHRIDCLKKWRYVKTQIMTTNVCPATITTNLTFKKSDGEYHPYKDYKSIHKNWSIVPDVTADSCSYWKWFVGEYNEKLAVTYNANPAEVPPEWKEITWQQIKENLKDAYNIELDEFDPHF